MKNKKWLAVALLAASGALGLAACSGTSSSSQATSQDASESSSAATTSSDETSESSSAASTDIVPTKVKINQPGTVEVDSTIKIADICTFTPEDANKFTLEPKDPFMVTVHGNESFTVNAAGKTTIAIKTEAGGKSKTLGTIRVSALSKQGLALNEFVQGISNEFAVEAVWLDIEGKTLAQLTEEDIQNAGESFADLVVTPNYVLDWTYGAYSGITIESDGNTYGYELYDAEGAEIPTEDYTDLQSELAKVDEVVLTQRVDAAYVNRYFVIDQLLDLSEWGEETDAETGVSIFRATSSDIALNFLSSLYGMAITSYYNASATISFNVEENFLFGTVQMDQNYDGKKIANLMTFKLIAGEGAHIAILDEAVKNALPPAGIDTKPLVDAFAAFEENFLVNWEIGIFDRDTYQPMEGFYEHNTVGVSILDGDTIAYAARERDAETAALGEETTYGGLFVDTENGGIFSLDADENNLLVKSSETPITGSAEIKTIPEARDGMNFADTYAITKNVLDGAGLALDKKSGVYVYNATFDECVLSYLLSSFCPFGYTDSDNLPMFYNPANAQYIEGFIGIGEGFVQIGIFERVRLDEEGHSGLQGIQAIIHSAGQGKIDLGDNLVDAFDGLFK